MTASDGASATAPRDDAGGSSYYGQPIIKQPVWKPEIPAYFFTGGLAGASAGLAYLSAARPYRGRRVARRQPQARESMIATRRPARLRFRLTGLRPPVLGLPAAVV